MRKASLLIILLSLCTLCMAEERPDSTLSVTLVSFNLSTSIGLNLEVSWSTSQETNVLGYRIYRNTADDFTTAVPLFNDLINAANTDSMAYYTYNDLTVQNSHIYYYWLSAVDFANTDLLFGPLDVEYSIIGNEENYMLEGLSHLKNAYPNPFNPETKIELSIKDNESGELTILNIKGQVIRRITNLTAGNHTYTWNGTDESGKDVASGVYYYRLKTQTTDILKKMILIK